jgi:hypothetical protein
MVDSVALSQAFMTNTAGFFVTRCLLVSPRLQRQNDSKLTFCHLQGLFEGGFIPGAILYLYYFYYSRKEMAIHLAAFWGVSPFAIGLRRAPTLVLLSFSAHICTSGHSRIKPVLRLLTRELIHSLRIDPEHRQHRRSLHRRRAHLNAGHPRSPGLVLALLD